MAQDRTVWAAAPPHIAAGTRLNGIYEIDRPIGSGGMGDIYKGHAIQTGDAVAIKVIRPDLAEHEAALALFRKEASVLHNLLHEAIVRYYVFSVDPAIGRPYLAMEFVDGPSLSEVLEKGPLAYEAVRSLQRRLAAGLQVAHELGIVHRDISPDNIILPASDVTRAKIIDFGIARTVQIGGGTIIGGGFAGKHNYASPEQLGLFGGEVTARSDIYSLGLVLAEALAGRIDMSGTQVELIEKRRVVPDLSRIEPRMRPLIERMLQPDPAGRPESMADVAEWRSGSPTAVSRLDLERSSTQFGRIVPEEPAPRRRSAKGALVAFGVLTIAALAAGGAVYVIAGRQQPEELLPETAATAVVPGPAQKGLDILVVPRETDGGPAPNGGAEATADGGVVQPQREESEQTEDEVALGAETEESEEPGGDFPSGQIETPRPQEPPPGNVALGGETGEAEEVGVESPPEGLEIPPAAGTEDALLTRVAQVTSYVLAYGRDGADCFFAASPTVTETGDSARPIKASVEVFGSSVEVASALDADFNDANGFYADISVRQVSEAQCPVVDFLDRVGARAGTAPQLRIAADLLGPGDSLQGSVAADASRHIELLLVSSAGIVENVTSGARQAVGGAEFDVQVETPAPGSAEPQLLVALATDAPLALPSASTPAAEYFADVLAAAERSGQEIGVAVKYFKAGG